MLCSRIQLRRGPHSKERRSTRHFFYVQFEFARDGHLGSRQCRHRTHHQPTYFQSRPTKDERLLVVVLPSALGTFSEKPKRASNSGDDAACLRHRVKEERNQRHTRDRFFVNVALFLIRFCQMNNRVMIIFLSNLQRCDKYNVFISHVLTEHDNHAAF